MHFWWSTSISWPSITSSDSSGSESILAQTCIVAHLICLSDHVGYWGDFNGRYWMHYLVNLLNLGWWLIQVVVWVLTEFWQRWLVLITTVYWHLGKLVLDSDRVTSCLFSFGLFSWNGRIFLLKFPLWSGWDLELPESIEVAMVESRLTLLCLSLDKFNLFLELCDGMSMGISLIETWLVFW